MFKVHEHSNCACPLCCPEKYSSGTHSVITVPSEPISVGFTGNYPLKTLINYGWCCPKCECVYAPSVMKCMSCGPIIGYNGNTTEVKTTT